MNKRLKLAALSASKTLRSGKTFANADSSEETSSYFAGEKSSAKTGRRKKRIPIKINHEAADDEANIETNIEANVENTNVKSAVVVKSETVEVSTDAKGIETEKRSARTGAKKRIPIKIMHEAADDEENVEANIEANIEDTNVKPAVVEKSETVEVSTDAKDIKTKEREIKDENVEQSTDPKNIKVEKQWMPPNWETIFENIKEMRIHETAPVDTMGCHKCTDPNASPMVSRYQSLVALMLSCQTKDQVTHAAMQRLITYGCTPNLIAVTPDDVLGKLIYPVGFWKKKVQYIKMTSVILLRKFGGDIPRTVKKLSELPGVGPKIAHICMRIAWGEITGIGVDTHVHRISNRLGWVRKPTKTPEETRIDLEDWLPKPLWVKVNHLLVGFGQETCLSQYPKCLECLNKDICPYASESKKAKK